LKQPFYILLLVFATLNAAAQPSVSKNNILIGEPIEITLPGAATFKNIPDSIAHFEIIDKTSPQKLIITSFDSGSWRLPALSYIDDGIPQTTDSLLIQVGYMPIDSTNNPRDIKTIIDVENIDWKRIILLAILVICAIITFGILFWLYRSRQKLPAATQRKHYFEKAMQSLEHLQQQQQKNAISSDELHIALSNIFKSYLSNIAFNIPQSTSSEIWNTLEKFKLEAQVAEQTKQALNLNDASKFAQYNPSFTENNNAIQFIRNSIADIHKNKKA
jgi:uncharacterized protein YsxB (DUF464 family)